MLYTILRRSLHLNSPPPSYTSRQFYLSYIFFWMVYCFAEILAEVFQPDGRRDKGSPELQDETLAAAGSSFSCLPERCVEDGWYCPRWPTPLSTTFLNVSVLLPSTDPAFFLFIFFFIPACPVSLCPYLTCKTLDWPTLTGTSPFYCPCAHLVCPTSMFFPRIWTGWWMGLDLQESMIIYIELVFKDWGWGVVLIAF